MRGLAVQPTSDRWSSDDRPPTLTEPSASVEATVCAIWRAALGRKAGSDDDNILDLQVGVRRIMRMVDDIETATGQRIAPTTVLRLGTARALGEAVARDLWPAASPIIQIRPGDASPPLYLISGGGGFILEQVQLAREIRHPGAIYGLQLPGLDGIETPLDTMDGIAGYYVEHVGRFQPTGPYHVAGYSFGGLVAVEMARLWLQSGQKVGFVGLLDSNINEKFWPRSAWLGFMAHRARINLRTLRHMPAGQAIGAARHLIGQLASKALRRLRPRQELMPAESVYYIGGLPDALQKVRDASLAAFESYDPGFVDGKISLIKSTEGDPHACDPVLVWRRLIRDLDVATVGGSHATMVRTPHNRALAAEISRRLGSWGSLGDTILN